MEVGTGSGGHSSNVAIGGFSTPLASNTTGSSNIAIGVAALAANTIGYNNTGVGARALESNTIGNNNTAYGVEALRYQNSGSYNVGIGTNAMRSAANTVGNTALGHQALGLGVLTGSFNTAIGMESMRNSTTARENVAVGFWSMEANTIGKLNTSIGIWSLSENLSGIGNVAVGDSSMVSNISGNNNTTVGRLADVGSDGLTNATAIGANAIVGASNSLVLGNNAAVGIGTSIPDAPLTIKKSGGFLGGDVALSINRTDSKSFVLISSVNQSGVLLWTDGVAQDAGMFIDNADSDKLKFAMGNVADSLNRVNNTKMTMDQSGRLGIGTSAPGGQFELSLDEGRKPSTNTWTITSDERLKNISGTYDKGLKEIIQLVPIKYHYKNVGDKTFDEQVLATENVGFSAQEVQKVFPESVGTDNDGYLNFNMHPILVAQVNAIKEQQEEIEMLKEKLDSKDDRINTLESKMDALIHQMAQFDLDMQNCCSVHQNGNATGSIINLSEQAHLAQNVPNPFNQSTLIKYYLPENSAKAHIKISDTNGAFIKLIELTEIGYGQVIIEANSLAPGTYVYELLIGKTSIDAKQMIIQK